MTWEVIMPVALDIQKDGTVRGLIGVYINEKGAADWKPLSSDIIEQLRGMEPVSFSGKRFVSGNVQYVLGGVCYDLDAESDRFLHGR